MPGHPIPPSSADQATQDIELLEKLFDEHDAIFLLMDSRESRWLPTVLGAAKGRIPAITDRAIVHAARADAAYNGYASTMYACVDVWFMLAQAHML